MEDLLRTLTAAAGAAQGKHQQQRKQLHHGFGAKPPHPFVSSGQPYSQT
jgi:hypothetical protein